jgi:methionine synthase II (cobalamin-independent)
MKVQAAAAATTVQARSEVIGSLLRPHDLAEARDRREQEGVTAADFKRLEDRAVDEAIETQTRAGIDVITDGEMRRYAFYGHLIDSLEGFDKFGGWGIEFRDETGEKRGCGGPWWWRNSNGGATCASRSGPTCGHEPLIPRRSR